MSDLQSQARRQGGFEGFARTPLLAYKTFYIHCFNCMYILSALPLESGPLVVSLLLRITVVQASLVAAMQACSYSPELARMNGYAAAMES